MTTPPLDLARPDALPASGEALRSVLRDVPSPVVVVTVEGADGPRGATIGSFTSVALAPPLVSFNVTQGTQLHAALGDAPAFAVHLLDAGQADLAEHFALPDLDGEAQLAPFDHVRGGGPPLLRGALGILLCTPHARFEAGDHTVFVGHVTHVVEGSGHDPLLYVRQSYRGIGERVA
ncbi:flavin reductase family protein [Rubrivirga sp. IMCC45206]|uniref:flavin reductase family protein n=1 Tax=Rubrivirga sp. IMCC45206 TaxID=3391614 RepID=UPI00398FF059